MTYENKLTGSLDDQWISNITASAIGFSHQDTTPDGQLIQDKANCTRMHGPYILLICGNGEKIYQFGRHSFSQSTDNITKVDNQMKYDFKGIHGIYGEFDGHCHMHLLAMGDPFGVNKNIIYAHYRSEYKEHFRVGSAYFPDPIFYTLPIGCPANFHEAWRHLMVGVNDQPFCPGRGHQLPAGHPRPFC